jgi:hypothetical protein
MVVPAIERHGAIKAWIIHDTLFPKQGTGLKRQRCSADVPVTSQ